MLTPTRKYAHDEPRGLCMLGGIYSRERCPICGRKKVDNKKDAVACTEHPEQDAKRLEVRFKGISSRFISYAAASRFLTGLRFKHDEGTFDPRDYQRDNPLGFSNLISKWLDVKKKAVKPSTFKVLRPHAFRAIDHFGNKNIKEIGFAEIEDFSLSMNLADKTRSNILSDLHDFFTWLKRRQILKAIPEFPIIEFKMKFRKTVDKDTQGEIVSEVKRISYHLDPKIWLGIKWLATYYNVRPDEMRRLREGDIDLATGFLFFPDPKEKHPKIAPLVEEDIELLKSMPGSLPALPFFRHVKRHGVIEGRQYSSHVFKDWWDRACKNLEIVGVDLYGGTRHSTAKALRNIMSPEKIKKGSGHRTSKAFDRYFDYELEDVRDIYRQTIPGAKERPKDFKTSEKGKILKYEDKVGGR